jgi:hypothetical protein
MEKARQDTRCSFFSSVLIWFIAQPADYQIDLSGWKTGGMTV